MNTTTCDHTRGLCGKPDVPNNTPREKLEQKPAQCLCCGSQMQIRDMGSEAMSQLGMYLLVCMVCPLVDDDEAVEKSAV
jgi:hypothetical protein